MSENNQKVKNFIIACYQNEMSLIKNYLQSDIFTDLAIIEDQRNYSLIHISCLNNNLEMLILLIETEKILLKNQNYSEIEIEKTLCDWMNKSTQDGFYAIHFASFRGNIKILRMLKSLNANMFISNKEGLNGLHLSAQGDHPLILLFFKEEHLDINSLDKKHSTPLHWAAYSGCDEAVCFLITWKCEINSQDAEGFTPLHLASLSGNLKLVKKLIFSGANPKILNNKKKTAADLAKENDFITIFNFLEGEQSLSKIWNIDVCLKGKSKSKISLIIFIILYFGIMLDQIYFVFPSIQKNVLIIPHLLIYFFTFILFIISWQKEPGYVKKNPNYSFLEILELFENTNLSFCPQCEIAKPPRSKHCEICNKCILVYDHHCPWINNCIGARNHNIFLIFIIFTWLTLLYSIILGIFGLKNTNNQNINNFLFMTNFIKSNYYIIKMINIVFINLICIIFILPLSALIFVQIQNFFMDKTTSERFSFGILNKINDSEYSDDSYNKELIALSKTKKAKESKYFKFFQNCNLMCYENATNPNYQSIKRTFN